MIESELPPIAREKLAKAGELSAAEREQIKLGEELTGILSDFFTHKLDTDSLWVELKKKWDSGKPSVVKETQLRLIHTLSLGGSDPDTERYSAAVLSLETIKTQNRYSELEYQLGALKKLRQQYQQEKNQKFGAIKDGIREQVRAAAMNLAARQKNGASVDIESSLEATARSSPQWRQFSLSFEKQYGQKFEEVLNRLKATI